MKSLRLPVLTALILLAAGACRKNTASVPQAEPVILASAGAEVLTQEMFATEATRRGISPDDRVKRRALLSEMTDHLRLLAYAKAHSFENDPEVRRNHESLLIAKAREALGGGAEISLKPPTEEELQAAYNARRSTLATPVRIRVAMLMNADRTKLEAALGMVSSLPPERKDFGALAATHSDDQATRYVGGDFGEIVAGHSEGVLPPEAIQACFDLTQPGDTSRIVESPDGFRLFRLMARTEAEIPPFAKVRARLASDLVAARRRNVETEAATRIAALPGQSFPDRLP